MGPIDLTLDKLHFDLMNPRIGSALNQHDNLQKILDDQRGKLAELAEDIVTEGLSPIERLLVIKDEEDSNRFIVVEGNRRLAALRIMDNPAVMGGLSVVEALRKRLEKIAKDFDRNAVEPLSCYEVKNRDEANKWIYLRHTGANEGRGVVEWSGLATARFRGTDPALQALEFVVTYGNLDDNHKVLLNKTFPITTLDRLLSTKEVRQLIGIDVKEGILKSGISADEIMKPLRKIILDLAEKKINVSNLKDREAQVKYINSFAGEDKPDLSQKKSSSNVKDFKGTDFKKKPASVPHSKPRIYDPSERKTVVPRTSKLSVSVTKIAEIYKELKKLQMDDTPHACAVLIRVFLELSVDHFMKLNKLNTETKSSSGHVVYKKLGDKVSEAVEYLVKVKGLKRRDFAGMARSISVKQSPLSIDLLHAYVHSAIQTPKIRELRAAWDEAEPFFKHTWA